jgi:phosphonate transport system substrate-binding protein
MRAITVVFGLFLFSVVMKATADCTQQSLRLAVIPKKDMAVLVNEYQPLLQRLRQELSMPVEIVPMPSYESVIDAIVSGGVDVAWMGPASYLLAHQRDPNIEPFASLTIDKGHFTPAGHHYQALLLTRSDGPPDISSLRGSRVALSDPASTSGSVVPNAQFSEIVGLPLPGFFGSVVYSGSHDKSLDALLERRVDAAFVASVRADAYVREGRITGDTLRVLWRSAPIFYDPYVFSGSLCSALKDQIRTAMLAKPQGLDRFFTSQHATGLAPVSHADYAPLLQMMQP